MRIIQLSALGGEQTRTAQVAAQIQRKDAKTPRRKGDSQVQSKINRDDGSKKRSWNTRSSLRLGVFASLR